MTTYKDHVDFPTFLQHSHRSSNCKTGKTTGLVIDNSSCKHKNENTKYFFSKLVKLICTFLDPNDSVSLDTDKVPKLINSICHADQNIHLFSAYFRVQWNHQIYRWTRHRITLLDNIPIFLP